MPTKTPTFARRDGKKRSGSLIDKVADAANERYEEAWFNFHRYDTDDSGTIDLEELGGLLVDLKMHVGRSSRTEEQTRKWVQRELHKSDTNKDGVLSFEEFLAYYNSFVSRHRSQWDELYNISETHTLGKGAFGVVLMGKRAADGVGVAVKRLKKAGLAAELDLLHNEIAIWEDLDHPHLVQLLDVFEDTEHIILITELMHGGDLRMRLKAQAAGYFEEVAGARLAAQIVSAVAYLHSVAVVHCDLKPGNVLVVEPPEAVDVSALTVKVADFGLSQTMAKVDGDGDGDGDGLGGDDAAEPEVEREASTRDRNRPARLTSIVGTPNYWAPELVRLAQDDYSATHYDSAVDDWAIGCLIFELLAGSRPFDAEIEDVLFYKIIDNTPDFPEHLSAQATGLIKALICTDPAARLSAADALAHEWCTAAVNTHR